LGQPLRASELNYREDAAYLPLLLAGLMLGASFLFGDGIISPAIRRSRPKPTASITQ
jgi:K+ transporter